MDIRTQLSMVMHLDKCIGCHTCSVTCKNLWTNRQGTEYMWWNNVETRPGMGYPKHWENQNKYSGGWKIDNNKLKLNIGSRVKILSKIFSNDKQPVMFDYYEPVTYKYEDLIKAPQKDIQPVARAVSKITGNEINITFGPNWDDDLGGSSNYAANDINLGKEDREILEEFEKTFMMYLPRICNHCLNPACVASCPSGSIYKRQEDGMVLNDQNKCRGWRYCNSACPYKKIYFNWDRGKSEKCILCYPKMENGIPTACSSSCVGRIRYLGVLFYDNDKIKNALTLPEHKLLDALRESILDPNNEDVVTAAVKAGISNEWIEAAKKSPIYKFVKQYRIAFPLHLEYRTFPMIFYVPSLSPILKTYRTDDLNLENFRIPITFLASLFSLGNQMEIKQVLNKLLGIRKYMRGKELNDISLQETGKQMTGWNTADILEIYKLTTLSSDKERFIVPMNNQENLLSFKLQGDDGIYE